MKKHSWIYYLLFLAFGLFIGTHLTKLLNRPTMSSGALDQIRQLIVSSYVDTVDVSGLNEAAIAAMLNTLDPYSVYLPAVTAKEADEELQGRFDGIGVQFRMIDDTVTIMQPVSGGPSERIGILAGDKIITVDGESIAGVNMPTDDVMKRLRGPKGTRVDVEISRFGIAKPLKFTIVRDVIPSHSVDIDFMVNETIGYIKLSKFSATTSREIRNALQRLKKQGMEKLIFDLREMAAVFCKKPFKWPMNFCPKVSLLFIRKV